MTAIVDLLPYLSPVGAVANVTGGVSIGLANQTGVTEIPSFTGIAGTATLTITPTFNGCVGIPITVDYTINPLPTISAVPNQVQCAG